MAGQTSFAERFHVKSQLQETLRSRAVFRKGANLAWRAGVELPDRFCQPLLLAVSLDNLLSQCPFAIWQSVSSWGAFPPALLLLLGESNLAADNTTRPAMYLCRESTTWLLSKVENLSFLPLSPPLSHSFSLLL